MTFGIDFFFFTGGHQCLSWSTRIKVAVDTARGLSFFHDAKNRVIHPNIKSANILLDKVCSSDNFFCLLALVFT